MSFTFPFPSYATSQGAYAQELARRGGVLQKNRDVMLARLAFIRSPFATAQDKLYEGDVLGSLTAADPQSAAMPALPATTPAISDLGDRLNPSQLSPGQLTALVGGGAALVGGAALLGAAIAGGNDDAPKRRRKKSGGRKKGSSLKRRKSGSGGSKRNARRNRPGGAVKQRYKGKRVLITKNGQPYVIMGNGKARFIRK